MTVHSHTLWGGDEPATDTQSIRRALLVLRMLGTAGHAGLPIACPRWWSS
jgi:hypothetical protein